MSRINNITTQQTHTNTQQIFDNTTTQQSTNTYAWSQPWTCGAEQWPVLVVDYVSKHWQLPFLYNYFIILLFIIIIQNHHAMLPCHISTTVLLAVTLQQQCYTIRTTTPHNKQWAALHNNITWQAHTGLGPAVQSSGSLSASRLGSPRGRFKRMWMPSMIHLTQFSVN